MRQPLIAGNWKMNGTKASVERLLAGVDAGAAGIRASEQVVCPPELVQRLPGFGIRPADLAAAV